MREYIGKRSPDGCVVTVHGPKGAYPLPPCNNVRNHSPDGFNWGYGGSGPAQLSLALLCDCCGVEMAREYYQDFKFRVISGLEGDEWSLFESDVLQAISDIRKLREEKATTSS